MLDWYQVLNPLLAQMMITNNMLLLQVKNIQMKIQQYFIPYIVGKKFRCYGFFKHFAYQSLPWIRKTEFINKQWHYQYICD